VNDNLPTMPIVAAKDQQASQARPSPVRTWAALGTYAGYSNLPEAPASTTSGDAGEGGLVCAGEGVRL
jgi:hypothetical protein